MKTSGIASPRLITANRSQLIMDVVDVEKLIDEDHPARAIWEFVGRLDLRAYKSAIKSIEGEAGRPAYDPRLLISLWIFATSDGESSSREIERLCEYHPAYRWLSGMKVINHHTLSDFRINHKDKLDDLFTQVLGLLSAGNLITLRRITQDGTKIKACASSKSFRREGTIRSHLELARKQVAEMGDPRESCGKKRAAARARGLKDRRDRLEKALQELANIRAEKRTKKRRGEARASETDVEARVMKQGGGGFAPSYNVQLSVDAAHDIIVNVDVSQSGTDGHELKGAIEKVEERLGDKPKQVVADGGYTNNANIMSMADAKIDFIGSLPDSSKITDANYRGRGIAPEFQLKSFQYDWTSDRYVCPAGQSLLCVGRRASRPGVIMYNYRPAAGVCAMCTLRKGCQPLKTRRGREVTRVVPFPTVAEFHAKMKRKAAKEIYRTRSKTAEFPNAWIKDKFGLRQFRTRGKAKTKQEALWACVTYNIQQWIRLTWLPRLAACTA